MLNTSKSREVKSFLHQTVALSVEHRRKFPNGQTSEDDRIKATGQIAQLRGL